MECDGPAAPTPPLARVDAEEGPALKRRRLSITPLQAAVLAGEPGEEVVRASDQPHAFNAPEGADDRLADQELSRAVALVHQTKQPVASAVSTGTAVASLGAGCGLGSPGNRTAAVPSLAGSETTASDELAVLEASPETIPTLTLTPKRTYMCRVCGIGLSSASNRLRHQRAKHKLLPTAPIPSLAPPSSSAAQHAAAAPIRPSKKRVTASTHSAANRSSARSVVSPSIFAAVALEDDFAREEEDLELQQFAAAAIMARPSEIPDLCDGQTTSTGDGDQSDGERMEDAAQASSGSETSRPEDSSSTSEGAVTGMPLLLSDDALQASCLPFLQWLASPAMTHAETLVKKRGRITSLSQLHPIKCNLRFVFTLLTEKELADRVDLQVFTRLDVCQALFTALGDRRVGAGRFHALFLLAKKILIFLSSLESVARHQYCQPTMYESFLFVDSVCSESGQKRKIESRNRALLGLQATQQLLGANHARQPPQPFRIPTTWSSNAAPSQRSAGDGSSPTPPAHTAARGSASAAAAAAPSAAPSSNEMTKAELQQVAKYCLARLRELMVAPSSIDAAVLAVRDRWFMAILVCATIALSLAPRCQVLRQLRIGSSLTKDAVDGRYWVKLVGELTKSGKPTLFALPAELSSVYDAYLDSVRPRLLAPANADQPAAHDYVFVNRNGSAPRRDFSSCTSLITTAALGRPINAHAFRAAVVVGYYEMGASQSQMNILADIMGHSAQTAASFYYRPQFSQAATYANDKMTHFLLHAKA